MNRSRRRRRGFTLVEVLLVLVILVILGSFVVANYGNIQRKANVNAAKTQIQAFEGPLGMYRLDNGDYPQTAQGLSALWETPGDLADPDSWDGPYLGKRVPLDPWKHDYQYEYPGQNDPNTPDIWSLGQDGADGTDDDVVSWDKE